MRPPLPGPVAAGFGQSPVNIVSRKVKIVGMCTRFRFVMTCSHACFITEWQLCCHKRKQRSVMIRVSRPFLVPAKKTGTGILRSPNSGWSSYLLIMGKQSHYRSFRDYSLYHHAVFPSDVSTESVRWFDWLAAVSRSSLCYFTQCPIWAHLYVLS